MKSDYIAAERHDNIGIITLNNAKTLNSVNEKMLEELALKIREYDNLDQVKVIILKGIEKSFATGIDIKELAENIANARAIIARMQQSFEIIKNTNKPIIAVVSGFVLGIGCEIILSCDIVLATDNARFGLPELSIGLLPCFGGCGLLSNRIGKAKAMDMILTGKAFSADEAEQIGLISRIVTESAMVEEYTKIAQRIASLPPKTVSLAKKIITNGSLHQTINTENVISLNHIESGEFKQSLLNFANKTSSSTEK